MESINKPPGGQASQDISCLYTDQKVVRVVEPEADAGLITGEEFYRKLDYVCWKEMQKKLTARDMLTLAHVSSIFYQNNVTQDPLGLSRHQILTNFFLEKYYHTNPNIQSLYLNSMPLGFSRQCQPNSPFRLWLSKNFDELEQAWVMGGVLRQAALLRHLSNRAGKAENIATLEQDITIRCMAITSDRQVIAYRCEAILKICDLNQDQDNLGKQPVVSLTESLDMVECMASAANGLVITASWVRDLKVWDMNRSLSERCIATLTGHAGTITCLVTTPEGYVISGSTDRTLKVWNLQKPPGNECTTTLTGHEDRINCVAVCLNGLVISGSDDKTLKVWDLQKPQGNECIAIFKGHEGSINCVAVCPDGLVISGSDDKTLKVWNMKKASGNECTATLTGHEESVECVAIASDGRVVSASSDHTLKLWDLTNAPGRECVATLTGHNQKIGCLVSDPGGLVVSSSGDKTLRIWDPYRLINCAEKTNDLN
ncbi:WD40 repeat domain-containing protein [Sansalvadorimonas sp. 2012CJ34-2]|uniref:WD40 repeat domain-containing protein n=1 Tax=Parendozoicomonas callyspongiae TaxID=2942213 RepID=A0ABT0PDP8_9GAMM|nr:WD40 repeat domain-containing protein [Sansalvadorimonas sp. 2012CJ34-2]MCL6269509.1 WD40 repeat domain-containing protein [Sansalvadorimonas sp. 2012CJ34-2]